MEASSWPAIQDAEPPPEGSSVCRVVRPGLGDFKRWLKQETEMRGERIARERYRSQVCALAKRRYAQKLEYRKVGLLALDKASDANCDACLNAAGAIEALPVTSFSVTAARLLIDFTYESGIDESLADFDGGRLVMILTALRPHIRGALARDVDELLSDPNRPQRETWVGREPGS